MHTNRTRRFSSAALAGALVTTVLATAAPVNAQVAPTVVVSEVMFNPASAEDDWEWIELHNPGEVALDLAGWVVDDVNGTAVAAPNIAAGSVPAGGSAILFNVDDVSAADFEAAWGAGINLVAVTGWGAMGLNNGGDTIGLWENAASHADDQVAHANALVSVAYDGTIDDGSGSVHLTDLMNAASWALSTDGLATPVGPSYMAAAAGGNSGADVGSPGGMFPEPLPLFTQYIEGSSNNKAVEIANLGTTPIDLANYAVERYTNGSATVSATIPLSGALAAGDVFVVANGSSNATILAVADLTSGSANWNGDDALVLRNIVSTDVVDSIGQVGFDPGTQWGDETLGTANNTLCRISDVTSGDTDPTDIFDPAAEWEAKGIDNIDGLGELGCNPPPEPSTVIISQYMEGSSNNKALEIQNLGAAPVDLSTWDVERYSNGGVVPVAINLAGTLAPGDVFVLANPQANADILAVADLTDGNANWNGDDALVLTDGDNVIDSIGRVGEDPGSEWGDATTGTQDETLCRNSDVTSGDTDPFDVFDPSVEWTPQGLNNIDGLGNPTCSPQAVGDLILTQYVEGSSNNKALEIANFTGTPIDLGSYGIELYFNGSATVSSTIALTPGALADGDVFVVAHTSANAAILGVADQTTGSASWNGDDAIVLRNNDGATVADSIGQVGVDPGDEWGDATIGTQNDTLCRLDTIGSTGGDVDPTNAFDPSIEWTALGIDSVQGLGVVGCAPPAATLLIHEIQGNGAASPYDGQDVALEGVVTAEYQGPAQMGGFFVQEEDAEADADPATSEGIYVFDATPVTVGDTVRVVGTVVEFFEFTEIIAVTEVTVIPAVGPATPTVLSLPYPVGFDLESVEGMAVDVPGPLVVTDHFNVGRFGEISVSIDEPLLNPTQAAEPGPDANAVAELNDRSQLLFDDGRGGSELADVAYFGSDGTVRRGDVAADGLSGVMSYTFGAFKIQPLFDPLVADVFTRAEPRPTLPPEVGGTIKAASFNVLNYFTTLGDRGADTAEELTRQRDKIIAAVTQLDADIVGLIEIENNGTAIADIVAGFNDAVGAGTYDYINTGPIGTDVIAVGFVYKPAAVSPVGAFAVLDSSVDPTFIDTKNRPPVIQTFEDLASGERVTVAVNHFKSKGSDCNALGDPDIGDEQGNCNLTRTSAAVALANYLATDPTGGGTDDYLILGDINAYPNEDPIDAFEAAGYVDLLSIYAPQAQSFVFFGEGGRLDHALASPSLAAKVTGADEWSINAAEPRALDYNTSADGQNPPGLYVADAFRASDHDPVLVGLDLEPEGPPQVLMVVGAVNGGIAPSGDRPIVALLEDLGLDVMLVDDDVATAADADGKDLVVVSSSVVPSKVGDEFSSVPVPLVSWEGYLFDDFGFNTSGGGRNGETSSRTALTIVDGAHPLAAGNSGVTSVATVSSRFSYSRPEGDAQIVAKVGVNAVVFGYENGAALSGDAVAPARRVGLFPSYTTPRRLTPAGADIVAAGVLWALDSPSDPVNRAPNVDAGANTTINLPTVTTTVTGTATDDGLPVPPMLSYLWTGPAGVSFAAPDEATTTANFPGVGEFELTLTVSDGALAGADTVTVTVAEEMAPGTQIAYIAGNSTPPSGDRPIVAHLEAGGAVVTIIDDDVAAGTDFAGFDMIFLSTSVVLEKIGSLFADSPIPLLTTEQYLLDDNMMASAPIGMSSTTTISIAAVGNPLAAGKSGSVAITGVATGIGYATPAASAMLIATVQSRSVYFAYESGAAMVDGFVAPARRLYFPGTYLTAREANANYFDLLDAAVAWTAASQPAPG